MPMCLPQRENAINHTEPIIARTGHSVYLRIGAGFDST
jgi:hypothetical protein